jgi:poly-gamma-glutamate synthesis protein (capsule biosynthesis protein)
VQRARPRHAAPGAGQRRAATTLPILLVVAASVAAGVAIWRTGEDEPGSAGAVVVSTTATTAAPSTTAAPATTGPPVDEPATIAFAGDTNFEGSAAARLAEDPASVLAPFAPVLAGADLAVVNMETALGTGGTPAPKEFVFQAPAAALEAFRAAGVDVVSAANNHGMDMGIDGLQETLAAERSTGFPVIGIGADEAEAYEPFFAEVRGQRIAVIAATQVLDGSLVDEWTAGPSKPGVASAKRVDRLVSAVEAARADADTVVVFLHWGRERDTCPTSEQTELAATLVAAGADVVVGGHAHRVQGGGRLGDAVVHYGLGNFGFQANSAEGARTGVFVVTVTGRTVDAYEWVPGRIVDHQPRPLEGAAAAEEVAAWESQRGCTGLTE